MSIFNASPRKSAVATSAGVDEADTDEELMLRSMRAFQLETWGSRLHKAIQETEKYLDGLDRLEAVAQADKQSRRMQISTELDRLQELINRERNSSRTLPWKSRNTCTRYTLSENGRSQSLRRCGV